MRKYLKFFAFVFFLGLFTKNVAFAAADASSSSWGKGLYIVENIYDQENRYIKLNDGTYWLLNFTFDSFWDRFGGKDAQSLWLAPDRVEISRSTNHQYPYMMCNLESGRSVEARQINPTLLLYTTIERLRTNLNAELFAMRPENSSHNK